MSILQTSELTRRYGSRKGVENVNLEVGQGEIFGFLGPNGAGKSTTIRLLMGFLKPHAGQARIAGFDCWRENVRVKRAVGYLPGDLRLYSWMTLKSGVAIVSRARGVDIAVRARELAERFELEPKLPVSKMSRGTRQKLGLVLAMAHRPQLLILDEPTSGLDPLMQAVLAELLREAVADRQTVFFSSHTLSEVDALCDRVAIVRQGSIVIDEPLSALRQQAPRVVELAYADPAAATAAMLPDFLQPLEQVGSTRRCEMHGTAPRLLAWASQQPLVDLRIGPPDLEVLFHTLYHGSEADS
jgi:ABC-2 type transport system ATP-binding protein